MGHKICHCILYLGHKRYSDIVLYKVHIVHCGGTVCQLTALALSARRPFGPACGLDKLQLIVLSLF